jgi:hypothetical protein
MSLLGLLNIPVLWLGWAVLLLSFGLYAVFELLCGGYYKYQNLQQRYKAEWALVTGASSGVQPQMAGCLRLSHRTA